MSLSQAFAFVQAVTESAELASALHRLVPEARADLADVVALGQQFGFQFSEAQLRQAVGQDWWMRWAHATRNQSGPMPENHE